ncbi:MAG: type I phosphomannose isomerase catalytic subunit [Kouleothrix sp.]
MNLTPLILERKLDSRLWGGSTLGTWLGLAEAPAHLAESWQVYEHNRVAEGPLAGHTLAELARRYGAALLGRRPFARGGGDFPLLAKFIDAGTALSVQVHPDDAYAHTVEAHTGFHGKTEAWYILHAAPGADLIHGLVQPTDRAGFGQALRDGTLMQLLRRVPAQAGDTILVPAGTIHAINGGIMLFEIQQKSDLTYRIYDYDRRDAGGQLRELHIDRALDVSNFGRQPPASTVPERIDDTRTLLVRCAYFAMERWDLRRALTATTDPGSFAILTMIAGTAELGWASGARTLQRGESVVLPAELGEYRLSTAGAATLLCCSVP